MNRRDAMALAYVLGGEAILRGSTATGDEDWVVGFSRADGRFVVLSITSVDEYYDREDFQSFRCYDSISFV